MAKLIDADALMEPLDQWAQEMRVTWKSNVRVSFLIAGMVQKVEELTVSLPDASEPILAEAIALRARVEQLEAEKAELLDQISDVLEAIEKIDLNPVEEVTRLGYEGEG